MIVKLQELKDRYPLLRNLPNQSYNLNEVQVTFGKGCYDIKQPSEIRRSEGKARLWVALGSKIKDWSGLKWFAATEASSNSCPNSNINGR